MLPLELGCNLIFLNNYTGATDFMHYLFLAPSCSGRKEGELQGTNTICFLSGHVPFKTFLVDLLQNW